MEYFISESSVYRILKRFDLVQSPIFHMVSTKDKYEKPTKRVNELWQTDFSQFKVVDWVWYYLSTVLDDYSRYILVWKLSPTMNAEDVEEKLMIALRKSGLEQASVRHHPRLLTDNSLAYLSKDLARFLKRKRLDHIRGAPYHPMTQGKIERFHRSMKNVALLCNYFCPWELEQAIAAFVEYYKHQRYHELLDNMIPYDVYFRREQAVLSRREQIKEMTWSARRSHHLNSVCIIFNKLLVIESLSENFVIYPKKSEDVHLW
jgi:transposase InsO family protein